MIDNNELTSNGVDAQKSEDLIMKDFIDSLSHKGVIDIMCCISKSKLPDDGLFPNYSDKDIYESGYRDGVNNILEIIKIQLDGLQISK